MRRKYAGMYYSVKKTSKGYVWTIYDENQVKVQSSLENEDEGDQYLETETAARMDAIQAIQDHYN